MNKSESSSDSVVFWELACEGNFHTPGWPPAKATLVPASECKSRCVAELRGFFGHLAAVNSIVTGV
jgi:hypothetical protein